MNRARGRDSAPPQPRRAEAGRRIVISFALILLVDAARATAALATIPQTTLASYYAALKPSIPRAGTDAYVPPSQPEADAFRTAMARLLAGETADASAQLGALGYQLSYLHDASGATYLVAAEVGGVSKARGTYVFNPRWERSLAIEVPHPLFDTNTGEEGIQLFTALGARLLAIAGTHRCANGAASGCSGTTGACSAGASEPFRISDMGHSTPSFFLAAHQAAVDVGAAAFNLHGNSSAVPDVEISDGTNQPRSASAPVNVFRSALIAQGIAAASCNWAADTGLTLCGTTNVQGRFTNGSPDSCGVAASNATGTFFHVEQHLAIRNAPAGVIAAAATVIAPSPYTPPQITSLVPPSAAAGSADLTITIRGSGFRSGAIVRAASTDLTSTFVDASKLTVVLPASALKSPAMLSIVVVNLDTTATAAVGFPVLSQPSRTRAVKH